MLTNAEIDTIIAKERLTKNDVYLIHHHIDCIKKMNEDHPQGLPRDVYDATQRDLKRIVDRLLMEKEFIVRGLHEDSEISKTEKKPRLRLVDTQ